MSNVAAQTILKNLQLRRRNGSGSGNAILGSCSIERVRAVGWRGVCVCEAAFTQKKYIYIYIYICGGSKSFPFAKQNMSQIKTWIV